jgi:hypothetical protein
LFMRGRSYTLRRTLALKKNSNNNSKLLERGNSTAPGKAVLLIQGDSPWWRLFVIQPYDVDKLLSPLLVGRLPGAGTVTEEKLAKARNQSNERAARSGFGEARTAPWSIRPAPLRVDPWHRRINSCWTFDVLAIPLSKIERVCRSVCQPTRFWYPVFRAATWQVLP